MASAGTQLREKLATVIAIGQAVSQAAKQVRDAKTAEAASTQQQQREVTSGGSPGVQ